MSQHITSFQNVGTQLKSLQKALKNPLGNAGLLAGELSKRAKRLHHTHTLLSACKVCTCAADELLMVQMPVAAAVLV